ncbi:MAG: porin family protein [Bacteroidaceae bacterium]|nr:porin family protein [Bacteroidaceae bacterium]
MKKYLCTLVMAIAALLIAIPAHSQIIKFGIKGGLNLTELETNINGLKNNSMGYFVGPMVEITAPGVGLGVDGAIMYAQRGKDEMKMEGVEVPLNLKFTFGAGSTMSIFLAAGPDFFLNLKEIDLGAIDATIDGYKSKDKRAQVGLNLGGGIKLANHLQIGLNYQMPLGDSFTFKKVVDAVKDKEGAQFNTWQLSLAYIF